MYIYHIVIYIIIIPFYTNYKDQFLYVHIIISLY
jgi:hypothetical protein